MVIYAGRPHLARGWDLRKRSLVAAILAILAITSLAYGIVGPSMAGTPDRIQSLAFLDSEDHFTAYFILVDQQGKEMTTGGRVHLAIWDDLLATLHETTFDIEKGEFSVYDEPSGSQILAYVWDIPFTLIAKSDSRNDTLTADLSFACQGITLTKRFEEVPFPDELRAPNKAPIPDIRAPSIGWSKVALELNASQSYDPNLDEIEYIWSFGDDGNGSGSVVFHAYERPGHYTISLTLLDGQGGESTMERLVEIRNPEKLRIDGCGWASEWGWDEHDGQFCANVTLWNQAPVYVELHARDGGGRWARRRRR